MEQLDLEAVFRIERRDQQKNYGHSGRYHRCLRKTEDILKGKENK